MAETLLWGNRQLEGGGCSPKSTSAEGTWAAGPRKVGILPDIKGAVRMEASHRVCPETLNLTVALRSWTVTHSQPKVIIGTVISERHPQSEPQ